MIRVGVVGATGAMGRAACAAILDAEGLDLVAAVSRSAAGSRVADVLGVGEADLVYTDAVQSVHDAGAEVIVDLTSGEFAPEHIAWAIEHGVHVVEGTTGFAVDEAWRHAPVGIVIVPNFAIGAVLMMRFAEQAARSFDAAEIVELHHDGKADAPGGTAIATAGRIASARRGDWAPPGGDGAHPGARGADVDGIRVHAVRLPGLLAHQEVLFGGAGQTLTIRHDTTDRAAFMPGLLLAIRWAPAHPGLTVGLDAILD